MDAPKSFSWYSVFPTIVWLHLRLQITSSSPNFGINRRTKSTGQPTHIKRAEKRTEIAFHQLSTLVRGRFCSPCLEQRRSGGNGRRDVGRLVWHCGESPQEIHDQIGTDCSWCKGERDFVSFGFNMFITNGTVALSSHFIFDCF